MHPTDAILFSATPLIPAPRFGALEPLAAGRKRLIGASDGLYVEARTAALDLCVPLSQVPMPYGDLVPRLRCAAGAVPRALLAEFIAHASANAHQEVAAAILVNEDASGFELVWPEVQSSSAGHIRYIDTGIDDARLVIDLHSHATGRAFFSSQDDESDGSRAGPYLSMVVGRCDTAKPELVARLVLPPYFIPLPIDVLKATEVFA